MVNYKMEIKGYLFKSIQSDSTVAMYGSGANLAKVFRDMSTNGWELSDSREIELDKEGQMIFYIR